MSGRERQRNRITKEVLSRALSAPLRFDRDRAVAVPLREEEPWNLPGVSVESRGRAPQFGMQYGIPMFGGTATLGGSFLRERGAPPEYGANVRFTWGGGSSGDEAISSAPEEEEEE